MIDEQMYAAGYGIRPMRSARKFRPIGRPVGRLLAVFMLALACSVGLAVVAHGGTVTRNSTVVVQPGDTLWTIAEEHYPSDEVRTRVLDIESANGLRTPAIAVGETLRLPG